MTEIYGLKGQYKYEIGIDDDFRLRLTENEGWHLTNAGFNVAIWAKQDGWFQSWEKALQFTVHADIDSADINIQDLVLRVNISPVTIKQTYLTESNIGDLARDNWDQFFESLFNMVIAQVNVNNREFDFKKLDQQIELSAGQFPNNTINAFYQEEFLYVGLRFFND